MLTNIVQLDKVGMKYLDLVGGKNASLGEMLQNLTKLGVNIPGCFVITVSGYPAPLQATRYLTTLKKGASPWKLLINIAGKLIFYSILVGQFL